MGRIWGADHDYTLEEVLTEIAYFRGESYHTIRECGGQKKEEEDKEQDDVEGDLETGEGDVFDFEDDGGIETGDGEVNGTAQAGGVETDDEDGLDSMDAEDDGVKTEAGEEGLRMFGLDSKKRRKREGAEGKKGERFCMRTNFTKYAKMVRSVCKGCDYYLLYS